MTRYFLLKTDVLLHLAYCQVAELVDAPVSNTGGATRAGSSPALGTISLNDPAVDHGRRSLQKASYIFDLKMIRVEPVVFFIADVSKNTSGWKHLLL